MIARPARPQDAPAMTAILNAIIEIGGTTAHQSPKTIEAVRVDYIDGPDVIAGVVVEEAGRVIGWQSVGWWQGNADIGTFVQPGIQARGAGAVMFALTRDLVKQAGAKAIHATIRADNMPGLAYYARAGFVESGGDPGFALQDGRVVGRIYRRFDLV